MHAEYFNINHVYFQKKKKCLSKSSLLVNKVCFRLYLFFNIYITFNMSYFPFLVNSLIPRNTHFLVPRLCWNKSSITLFSFLLKCWPSFNENQSHFDYKIVQIKKYADECCLIKCENCGFNTHSQLWGNVLNLFRIISH